MRCSEWQNPRGRPCIREADTRISWIEAPNPGHIVHVHRDVCTAHADLIANRLEKRRVSVSRQALV